jgi:hypothetical protein
MDDIKVSVCMITYNHERYIAQAVESVLSQRITFPIEIVIGEDASRDRTQEILWGLAKQHPDTIRLKLGEQNIGGQANFMETFARCRGQYVAMLEGDDYWTCVDKLQRQADVLDDHPEWAMCFHPCACLYEDGLQGTPIYPFNWTKPVATIDDLFSANFIPTSAVLFRNRLFPEFPAWFRELLAGDWPLHILNAAHGDIGFMPEIMSVYRIHGSGVWSGATVADRLVAVFEVLSAIDHHFAGKYTRLIEACRAATIRYVVSQANAAASRVTDVAEQLGSTRVQMGEESIRSLRLEARLRALTDDNRRLQAFYDTWTKSILFRVEREIRRPFRRLGRYLRNRRQGGGGQSPPMEGMISKAA